MSQKYTEAIHAKRLIGMLKQEDPCKCCPVGKRYQFNRYGSILKTSSFREEICRICRGFIGGILLLCPCNEFGREEALRHTHLALEAKRYI